MNIKFILFISINLLSVSSSFGQKKYKQSLDSLIKYYRYVTIIDHKYDKPLKDSIHSILTDYKTYFQPINNSEKLGKSIVFFDYVKHICILDLNAYDTNSISKQGNYIVLTDTSKHIYFNSKHRIAGRGYFELKELKFISNDEYYALKFIYFFKQAIYYCNGGRFKKRKKYTIEKFSFDAVNN